MTLSTNNAYQNHIKWIFWGTVLSCIPTPSGIAGSISTSLCMLLVLTGCVSLVRFSNYFLRSVWLISASIFITISFAVLPFFPGVLSFPFTKYAILLLEALSVICSLFGDYCICSGFAEVAARRNQVRLQNYCILRRNILFLCNVALSLCAFLLALFHSTVATVLLIVLAVLSVAISLYYCHILQVVKRLSSYVESK